MQFKPGNKGGPGRPKGTGKPTSKARRMREAFQQAVTDEQVEEIAHEMVRYVLESFKPQKQIVDGKVVETSPKPDAAVIKQLLDRLMGPPAPIEVMERLADIETKLGIGP